MLFVIMLGLLAGDGDLLSTKRKNVLVTSAGRRVSLVRAFQRELKVLFPTAKVIAADAVPEFSAACQVADEWCYLPKVGEADFASSLLKACDHFDIGLIVPTIDTELLSLESMRAELSQQGTELLLCDADFIKICRDKRKTYDFFLAHDIAAPKILDKSALSYPLFIKPFDGSCSQGTLLVQKGEDLPERLLLDDSLLFFEAVDTNNFDEFTCDLYYDRSGILRCVVPRQRLEVRAGEVSKALTVKNEIIPFLQSRIGRIAGAFGCVTLQIFKHKERAEYAGIEINARFGGGYPLSYLAGANFPQWALKEHFHGEAIASYDDWEGNLLLLRYDHEVIVPQERSKAALPEQHLSAAVRPVELAGVHQHPFYL